MATVNNNLSDYDASLVPDASNMKFAIVASEWNEEITNGLLNGAYSTLLKHRAIESNIVVHRVPGSFELPLGAQLFLEKGNVDSVICIGSVIRGETAHFDYVCEAVSQGVKDVSLKYGKPVIFGVLTDDNIQQSRDRSGGKHGNKGDEAAVTAIKMVALSNSL
ncbi:MAG: 6,7-dimethyl-8-ribityllumazine synthase [Crocinitomicaceae bacterium]|nr:6,7-dimethyl-8-ribityllumazine synthase [Crocinitomicaceae bacterium]|tara:strand:- start:723 stop:1211 length:489 start_codon:yes stop_codon:yes gene_type:complete